MKIKNSALFQTKNFINNNWVDSSSKINVTNPADESVIGQIPNLEILQLKEAIDFAHLGFLQWKKFSGKERAKILRKWYELILENVDDLASILTLEQGKPLAEARGEIIYAANFVEWFAEDAKRILGDVILAPKDNQKIITTREPVGVVAAITPWNFPSAMITRKAAAALAAGCSVIIKPAELTPFSALALAELAKQAGFPDGVFNIVTGDAQKIGEEFCQNPKIRKLSFTGSTRVGKLLFAQCANDLKKISLELGGNAPFIVFADANLDAAVDGLIHAKFRNAGQACTCVNRIFLDEKIHDIFLEKFLTKAKKLKVGDGFDPLSNLGPIINETAIKKIQRLFDDAINKGAKCELGGKIISQKFFEPTILTNAQDNMDFAKEEIFGPLAAIYKFSDEAEVIKRANATTYGLGSYVYTNDMSRIMHLSNQLEYGMVAINECSFATEVAPFGGIKHSGMGREGSHLGIEEFCQVKTLHLTYF
jgi:succinate-semialdehyde dehydrogenase/glutarate-semialdehyde dehydrogenase